MPAFFVNLRLSVFESTSLPQIKSSVFAVRSAPPWAQTQEAHRLKFSGAYIGGRAAKRKFRAFALYRAHEQNCETRPKLLQPDVV